MGQRPYQILLDFPKVYEFLVHIYARDGRNGQAAPFFEYAQSHSYFDASQSHRIGLWEEDGELAAVAFFEMKPGTVLLAVRPDCRRLLPEMVTYAERRLCNESGEIRMNVLSTQAELRAELAARGYHRTQFWVMTGYPYDKGPLPYELPDGFRFLDAGEPDDFWKHRVCTWYGFNHGDEGAPDRDIEDLIHYTASPHFQRDLNVTVVAPNGEYACFAGVWMVPENRLAYLEPLCTMPQYRRKGLAAAALAELQRRTAIKGAVFLTGGSNPFYQSIGFEPAYTDEIWEKA
ncbi:MAG: GNAT family N-acetyltransferase [Clostridiaceae bacterium]|nr:GNAT family N-acetyltransferase [Clostridiaceae bacterium]